MSKLEMELQTHIDQTAPSGAAQNEFISIDEFDAMLSNKNHDHITDEIVAALGGIDKMLIEYIRITREHENEELLSGPDMQKIANIVSTVPTAPTESMWDNLYKRAKLMDNTFHFSSSDTVWHSIIFDQQVADRIVAVTLSRYMWTFLGIAIVILFACCFEMYLGAALATLAIIVPFLVLMILSCNIPSLLLILCTFDFWMKVGYSIILAIASGIYMRGLNVWSAEWITALDLNFVLIVLLIVNVSLIEGYHGNWKVTFIFGLIVSLIFSWCAVLWTLNPYAFKEQQFELWSGYSIGLQEWMASCYRVLSLFLWKQTLMAAYTRGEWCICIYLTPYIKWVDGDITCTYRKQSNVNSQK